MLAAAAAVAKESLRSMSESFRVRIGGRPRKGVERPRPAPTWQQRKEVATASWLPGVVQTRTGRIRLERPEPARLAAYWAGYRGCDRGGGSGGGGHRGPVRARADRIPAEGVKS
ncbi:hypothetical protein GCM10009665_50520 [Kitasatospora nipponensis]|uniref:Uncharacterized protein n=1 Tax=Kitasatospora nipponensis TaxID=258049 RepID=A0ABP4H8L5_9ACTN